MRPFRLISSKFLKVVMLPLLFAACGGDEQCHYEIGATNFVIEPDSAYYFEINNPGGYIYLSGGHRGVVVVRTGYDQFYAYERACPLDNGTAVEVTADWGSSLLECPVCHSQFIVEADGMPTSESAAKCPLFQYSTTYSGGKLYVY